MSELFTDTDQLKASFDINKDDIARLCPECRNKPACVEWGKVEELTCFCLESIF
ncbi:MAG TPA: hypothetical protein P5521_00115 [Candidatus Omnitrophota bacterium]|nr:hypothetical protein [Candidatus Omnitrophota bacterium]HRZ66516.1 hypothetical protein [Candidatus Omnitrophota bacterium]